MTRWTRAAAAGAAHQHDAALPILRAGDVVPLDADRDLWDMWPIAHRDGRTALIDARQWWFFLAVDRQHDPEARHDRARILLYSLGDEGWRGHGPAFPDGFSPGSREWSGTAIVSDDGTAVTMHFTAAGRRDGGAQFEQRLFATTGHFARGRLSNWSVPIETVRADGDVYRIADQDAPIDDRIIGFRDPGYFHDPATGQEHILFTGSAGRSDDVHDGVIGIATLRDGTWQEGPPVVEAVGVNSELERPHIVVRDTLHYLFWSTQAKRFAPGIGAPTGLYGMVASSIAGPWRPLNGTGLVAANPRAEPFQAYCWWVTGECQVISFVDYWGLNGGDPSAGIRYRRAHFGGTAAPFFGIALAGDRATILPAEETV